MDKTESCVQMIYEYLDESNKSGDLIWSNGVKRILIFKNLSGKKEFIFSFRDGNGEWKKEIRFKTKSQAKSYAETYIIIDSLVEGGSNEN